MAPGAQCFRRLITQRLNVERDAVGAPVGALDRQEEVHLRSRRQAEETRILKRIAQGVRQRVDLQRFQVALERSAERGKVVGLEELVLLAGTRTTASS